MNTLLNYYYDGTTSPDICVEQVQETTEYEQDWWYSFISSNINQACQRKINLYVFHVETIRLGFKWRFRIIIIKVGVHLCVCLIEFDK
jgi:hypothetical protein